MPVLPAERLVPTARAGRGAVARALARHTTTAAPALLEATGPGTFRCAACAHRCSFDGARERVGACGVRFVEAGDLRVPFGYVARRYVRAVETNTIFHVRPGSAALTFGMYGCDLRCPYCHNGHVSQAWDDEGSTEVPSPITATALVDEAVASGCEVVCSAYNEPMITAEWGHAVFAEARARGLVTALVSDGHTTLEALRYMRDVTDVFRLDLKAWDAAHYRRLGGRLEPVLDGLVTARELGYWVEVVSLVVPGFNDDVVAFREIAARLHAIGGGDLPWHIDAFYPRFKMQDRVGSSRVDLQACKLEYSIVSPK